MSLIEQIAIARQEDAARDALLKDRLTATLIAICTQEMLRFGRASLFFQRINQSAGLRRTALSEFRELILFFLSIPCFKVSHFFFKIAYSLQQRRLSRLGQHCARMGGQDFSLQFDNLGSNDRSVTDIYKRLRNLKCRFQRTDSRVGVVERD